MISCENYPFDSAGVTALGLLPPLALASKAAGNAIEGSMVILVGLATSTVLNLLVMPALALRYGRFV